MSYSPALDQLRNEDLAYRLQQINAHFGTSLTLNDLTTLSYDVCGILPTLVSAVVAGKTYIMEKISNNSFVVYRVENDGSRTTIWSF